ncbi:hypothetical protein OH807_06165 [Kitasatospora sp. NBC_01560]|uniref:hypothetical protein n=1 Tax=Kitasatospora sp. NBC_01560 TaxID=2975965 RepID=UPI0038702A76
MSITTHDTVEIDHPRDSLRAAAPGYRVTPLRDLLPMPAIDQTDPADTDNLMEHGEDGRRAIGARCRISMGYLD